MRECELARDGEAKDWQVFRKKVCDCTMTLDLGVRTVVLGVVHDPIAEETYAAERCSGATLNGQTIRVSDTDELIRALLATSFSHDQEEGMSVGLDLFGKFARLTRGVRQL